MDDALEIILKTCVYSLCTFRPAVKAEPEIEDSVKNDRIHLHFKFEKFKFHSFKFKFGGSNYL